MTGTEGADYTQRLVNRSARHWKQVLDVQRPYRHHLRKQALGRTIDVGCGIGRNLVSLPDGSIGVDHNVSSVARATAAGLAAATVDEWRSSPPPHESFDSLLLSHVVEHMELGQAADLVSEYLPFVRPEGKVFFVCPQERGYRTDSTHVSFTSGEDLETLAHMVGLTPEPWQSFPLPRAFGRLFTYNEFTLLARKPPRRSH